MSGSKKTKQAPSGGVGTPNAPPTGADQKRDHAANSKNGNAVSKLAGAAHTLTGKSPPQLPIYEVNFVAFNNQYGGTFLQSIVQTIDNDDDIDWGASYKNRRADHGDLLGNLPVTTGIYREYHVEENKLPKPAFMRLVADVANRRLYVTPTHYDVWLNEAPKPETTYLYQPIANTHPGAKNPFFLLRGVSPFNANFD